MVKNLVAGITGGPATGKSLVSAEFRSLGAALIDADVIAREVLGPGRPELEAAVRAFGNSIVGPDGTLLRKVLADIVFSDYNRLAELTAITRPAILAIIRERIAVLKEAAEAQVIAVDAPLLFESGLDRDVEKVIVVYTDEDVQLARLMKRDNIDEAAARCRMASQMPLSEKMRRAHYLIDNNGTREETLREVREVFKRLTLEKC
ncbi:MAG: dephospho-CoA kinase [Thermodesulfobacteriota bacterium]